MIADLGLAPHPEGGHFRETWRHDPGDGTRGAATAIYFLLRADERSHWHRVDADEVWLHHQGGPLTLRIKDGAGPVVDHLLGPDVAAGQQPQVRVPAGAWQAAEPVAGAVLVSCVVAPAFEFDGFELAPPGWSPEAPR